MMSILVRPIVAGLTAAVLLGSASAALAQGYGYGGYGYDYGYAPPPPPPPPRYGYGYGYGYGGRYYPHQETYVGPYGYAHRRCRAHRACYEGPSY